MFKVVSLDKRDFYFMFIVIFCLFLVLSLEMLFIVKDIDLFDKWYQLMIDTNSFNIAMTKEEAFSVFVNANVTSYMSRVVIPIFFVLHTYYSFQKIGINKLYVYFWGIMISMQFIMMAVTLEYMSGFYYIKMILYGLIIYKIFSLRRTVN